MLDTFSHPEAVGETARLLSGAVGAHGYVSGISTYHPDGPTVVDEDAPLRRPGDAAEDDPLQARSIAKIRCEEVASRCFSGPVVTTRLGIMVGPRDPTDRFSWWPVRLAEDGEVLAPGDPKRPVRFRFSDASDIAAWVVGMLAAGTSGTYNAVGPGRDVPISEVLDACRLAADEENSGEAGSVEMTWAAEEFLREQLREMPEEERPLWFPEDQIPFQKVDSSQALAGARRRPDLPASLRNRQGYPGLGPLAASRPGGRELGAGFSPGIERELLRRWHARRG